MTSTFQTVNAIGWGYFEKLGKQKVLQVQSSTEPPKKLALGERAVMADGADFLLVLLKEQGQAVEPVYPIEGAPLIVVPSGIFRSAPNPNAARLLQSYLLSAEAQRIFVDVFANRTFHGLVKEKPGRTPFASIKVMKTDPAEVEAQSEGIKARYAKLFGV